MDTTTQTVKLLTLAAAMFAGLIGIPFWLRNVRIRDLLSSTKDRGGLRSQGAAAEAQRRPNVILILSDDMGYSDLPKFGKSEISTPAIDRLAGEGVLFTDAYVTAPICVALRMGLLTGQYQQRFGIYDNIYGEAKVRLFRRATLLPELFQRAGYRTALVGKWHLNGNKLLQYGTSAPQQRGFDEFIGIRGGDSSFWQGTPVYRGEKKFPASEYLTDFWGREACECQ